MTGGSEAQDEYERFEGAVRSSGAAFAKANSVLSFGKLKRNQRGDDGGYGGGARGIHPSLKRAFARQLMWRP